MPKHIVFDTVGTLVSYAHFHDTISSRLGPSLAAYNISPQLLGFAWLESAEREYTYLSLSGRYIPFATVFGAIFFRVLHAAGVPDPHSIASEEDVAFFLREYKNCDVRPGSRECVEKLQRAGFTVWAFSSADRERITGYFERGDIAIASDHIITCDDIGVGKPEIRAYEKVREKMGVEEGERVWYAAAHGWDVSAAGRAGFRTAYCLVLEKEPLEGVFGRMDVTSEWLVGLAESVIASEEAEA
jgi:2-haloacid dehalogenase